MLGQVTSFLRGFVSQANACAELAFLSVVIDVDTKEVVGRHGHLEVVAQPFGPAVTAMLPAGPVSQVVAIQVMLFFPVVSLQDVRRRWVVQVGHGQLDGFLQGAQVYLHVAGGQFQFRLQGLAVLARGVFDQVTAEVPVDPQKVTQVPGNLTIGQSGESKVPFVGVGIHVVQLFQHLRHEDFAIRDAWLDGFFGGHVPALQVVQRFLPMLGILLPEIRELQEINPTLFLFGVVTLRAVGLEECCNRGSFSVMEPGRGFLFRNPGFLPLSQGDCPDKNQQGHGDHDDNQDKRPTGGIQPGDQI